MIVAVLATVLATSSITATPDRIALPGGFKWALLAGLRERLGGKFILGGIADAQKTCEIQASCITVDRVKEQALVDGRLHAARSITEMADAVKVAGKSPIAVVSVIWAGKTAKGDMDVLMVVNDAKTGKAQRKLATIGATPYAPGMSSMSGRVRRLVDLPS